MNPGIVYPFVAEFINQEPTPIIKIPHAPELADAQIDLGRILAKGRECIARAAAKKTEALDLIVRLTAFRRAEPRLARKRFATRKGWKAHHRDMRKSWKQAIRAAAVEANRASTCETLAIASFASEMHRPEREDAIKATRARRSA